MPVSRCARSGLHGARLGFLRVCIVCRWYSAFVDIAYSVSAAVVANGFLCTVLLA